MGQKKFNDHFLISQKLIDHKAVSDHAILDEGDNTSDHLPIVMKVSMQFESGIPIPESKSAPSLKWEKVSHGHRIKYASQLASLIDSCELPAPLLMCRSSCKCDEIRCHTALQQEYDLLNKCVLQASDALPRYRRGVEK